VSNGGVVVDCGGDKAWKRLQVGQVTAVDVAVVDVNERVAVLTLVLRRHAQHVRQHSNQLAELTHENTQFTLS